jgi:phage terminase large subunit-like protein
MRLNDDFATFAHAHQRPPLAANNGGLWTTWLALGGRGAGKTRLGAEWVRALVYGHSPYAAHACGHIALVGESEHDVREVMIEGPAGLLRAGPRSERPHWTSSRSRLEWPNGAVAQAFSADDPDSLRGPQFDAAWCDELAKWRYAQAAFDMLQFGLRLGTRPRQLITTTPRPIPLLKRLIADPRTAVTRAGTKANAAYLAPGFLDEILTRYAGTRLGRQEIDGEIIEDRQDALWSRAMIEAARVDTAPELVRIVVGIDPPASSRESANACGLVVAGLAEDGCVYILEDATLAGLAPDAWASRRAGGGSQSGRRDGRRGAAQCRRLGAGEDGACDARQICARRAGGRALCAGQGEARGPCDAGARRPDVRFRARRPVGRRLTRPARRAGVGGDGIDGAKLERAEDQEALTVILRCEP